MATWTVTFGECVENHAGMQKLGTTASTGFSIFDILMAARVAKSAGYHVEYHRLSDVLSMEQKALLTADEISDACILVIRKGAQVFFKPEDYDKFAKEIVDTKDMVDKKAVMRGKVVNKHARWNLCYADVAQTAKIEEGKGTVVAFSSVPQLNQIRTLLPTLLGDKAKELFAELNYYYDVKTCGIGYHGDTERARVVGVRHGEALPLHYQWYYQGKAIGPNIKFDINGGDVYIMGAKAVGRDWKRRKIPTLRHAAGIDSKYINPKVKTKTKTKVEKKA